MGKTKYILAYEWAILSYDGGDECKIKQEIRKKKYTSADPFVLASYQQNILCQIEPSYCNRFVDMSVIHDSLGICKRCPINHTMMDALGCVLAFGLPLDIMPAIPLLQMSLADILQKVSGMSARQIFYQEIKHAVQSIVKFGYHYQRALSDNHIVRPGDLQIASQHTIPLPDRWDVEVKKDVVLTHISIADIIAYITSPAPVSLNHWRVLGHDHVTFLGNLFTKKYVNKASLDNLYKRWYIVFSNYVNHIRAEGQVSKSKQANHQLRLHFFSLLLS